MTQAEYEHLQDEISKLYESTKYKEYSAKEREGAKRFCLAVKSKLKQCYEYQNR